MTDIPLSRSGRSHPAGKLTQRLDIPVSEELEEEIIFLAKLYGMSKAECARFILERSLFGEVVIARQRAGMSVYGHGDDSRRNG